MVTLPRAPIHHGPSTMTHICYGPSTMDFPIPATHQDIHLPHWSPSTLVTFHTGHLPHWSPSTLVTFHTGHLPHWSFHLGHASS
ncbi:hypothetical protein Pdw03_3041 [Penicillium digitatum]|uniref:Uncharacterized protein n=1 Tax=Penicillium digitatum TaxID=36651 RepID=A0A7T6XFL4_PENDI|nr:hypothetical protein Pdw03_3041 [Penicillium digitatum]